MQQRCDINDLTAEHSFTKVFKGVLGVAVLMSTYQTLELNLR